VFRRFFWKAVKPKALIPERFGIYAGAQKIVTSADGDQAAGELRRCKSLLATAERAAE
jgi:hypothetical protein